MCVCVAVRISVYLCFHVSLYSIFVVSFSNYLSFLGFPSLWAYVLVSVYLSPSASLSLNTLF
jgi:hypothetical protein